MHYSDGKMCCAFCGRSDDLSIDHLVPRSSLLKSEVGRDIGRRLWARLKLEGYPEGYRILCRVCNSARNRLPAPGLPSWPADLSGRPLLRVVRLERRTPRGRKYEIEAWARPGDSDYDAAAASTAQAAWSVRANGPWWERPVPAPSRVDFLFAPISQEMREFKIQFETESGLRLTLFGRGGRAGFIQLLREFYSEEFYIREVDESNPQSPPRYRFKSELRPFRFENRWPDSGTSLCDYCGMPTRPAGPAESREAVFLPGYSAPDFERCGKCGAPAVPREEAVRRAAVAEVEWRTKLQDFIIVQLESSIRKPHLAQTTSPDPPVGRWILETDASLNPRDRRTDPESGATTFLAGGGIVLRDQKTRVVESHSVRLGYVSDSTQAEYLALLFGINRAAELGVRRLRVRVDNMAVIRTIKSNPPLKFEEDPTVPKIRAARSRFDSVEFVWAQSTHAIHRSDGTFSADFLARKAIGLGLRTR